MSVPPGHAGRAFSKDMQAHGNCRPADNSVKSRSFLLVAATLCISLIFSLLLAEVALRLIGVQSSLVYRPDPFYGWGHMPGRTFDWKTGDDVQQIVINSLGLRDHEYAYEKPDRVNRILVLGDSFAEGFQVSLGDRFSNLMADRLNELQMQSKVRYQVINAGVSGYGTDNELLFFRHEGHKYEPDLVVLALYVGNDIRNNWYPLENIDVGGFRKPYFELVDGRLELREFPFAKHATFSSRFKLFLNRNLVLYSFLREFRDRFRSRNQAPRNGTEAAIPLDIRLFDPDLSQDWLEAFRVTEALLSEMKTEVNAAGAELLVVLIPSRAQVYAGKWAREIEGRPGLKDHQWDLEQPNRMLAGILAKNGIDYLDLLPLLRTVSGQGDAEIYLARDGHWNSAGHHAAAGFINSRILSDYNGQSRQ